MKTDLDKSFMIEALKEAKLAFDEGEVPIGCVIVKNGQIIARGHNHRELHHDVSSHAEIEALKAAGEAFGDWRLMGCELFVTLEPCLMCAGAIIQSKVSRIVFGAFDEERGALASKVHALEYFKNDSDPMVTGGVLGKECKDILKTFFNEKR